ncbi:PilW family protein [uncultured Endozoicomonas sp.]|uniref:PilW family protein n=1 Tax=uncultured Endozoicomonas sp. TaxID=432652 RepID=UPI00261F6AEE|nr:PilW family protein [uncultured Endozoicomonas sp.]
MYIRTRSKCFQSGLTLIELMISMVLALLLMGVLASIYINSFSIQMTDSRSVALEHDARNAMTLLIRDLSSAGYANGAPLGDVAVTGLTVTNDCSNLSSALNMSVGLLAGRGDDGSITNCSIAANAKTGVYTGTYQTPADWVLVKGAIGVEIDSADLIDADNVDVYKNRNFLIANTVSGKIFKTGSSSLAIPSGFERGVIREYGFSLFYINTSNQLALVQLKNGALQAPVVIADNVEALRVRVGTAPDGDSGVTQLTGLNAATDGWGASDWNRVRSLEINLLVSTGTEPGYSDENVYQLGDVNYKAADSVKNKRRKLLTQTVFLYNLSYGQTQ